MTFKDQITNFLNQLHNEDYKVTDLFLNDSIKSGALHHLGYSLLKDHYEFYETELEFELTLEFQKHLTEYVNGLYYMSKGKKAKIYTTDDCGIGIIKLMDGKF